MSNETKKDQASGDVKSWGVFYFLPGGLLLISIISLVVKLFFWLKTADWPSYTIYDSLENIGLLDSYISLPNALGIQKLLHWILDLPATLTYFMLAIILYFVMLNTEN